MKVSNTVVGCLCAVGCEILYALSYIFTKQMTENESPLYLLGWRFLIAVVAMSVLVAVGVFRVNFRGKSLRSVLIIALFCPVLYFIGETFGITRTTASETGVFFACIPVVSLAGSTVILKKKPSVLQVAGILITLCGVVITVSAAGMSAGFSMTGYIFLLLAVFSYSLYSVFVDKASEYTGVEITYIMLIAGAAVFAAAAFAEAFFTGNVKHLLLLPVQNRNFLIATLYQGIGCSITAFLLSNAAIAKIGVNRTSSFIGVSTLVSIISGVIILNEQITLLQAVGAAVIIVGVYTANVKAAVQVKMNNI